LLAADGTKLVVADVNARVAKQVAQTCGAMVILGSEIVSSDVDFLALCALGGSFNETSII
jgi:leucine dehydrogenase